MCKQRPKNINRLENGHDDALVDKFSDRSIWAGPIVASYDAGALSRRNIKARLPSAKSVKHGANNSVAIDSKALLKILNLIFETNCDDPDAIDASHAWSVIMDELRFYPSYVPTLALRYICGMTVFDAGKILGVTPQRVLQRCDHAVSKLRAPDVCRRVRDSVVGWPNFYRNT